MIRTRLVWLLGAAALAYALAFTMFGAPSARRPRSAHAAGSAAATGATGAVRRSPARSRNAPVRSAQPARRSAAERDEEPWMPVPAAAPASVATPASAAPEAIPIDDYVRGYEGALVREPQDREWDRQVHSALRSALASGELAGAHLKRQRCRTTLCRVELQYDSLAARERAEEALPLRPPFNSDGLIHVDAPGSLDVTVYFSRQGHGLPDPAAEE